MTSALSAKVSKTFHARKIRLGNETCAQICTFLTRNDSFLSDSRIILKIREQKISGFFPIRGFKALVLDARHESGRIMRNERIYKLSDELRSNSEWTQYFGTQPDRRLNSRGAVSRSGVFSRRVESTFTAMGRIDFFSGGSNRLFRQIFEYKPCPFRPIFRLSTGGRTTRRACRNSTPKERARNRSPTTL